MSVLELEKAVTLLPPDELSLFSEWFSAYQQCHAYETKLHALFEEGASYPIWSPSDSFAAAEAMTKALEHEKAIQK